MVHRRWWLWVWLPVVAGCADNEADSQIGETREELVDEEAICTIEDAAPQVEVSVGLAAGAAGLDVLAGSNGRLPLTIANRSDAAGTVTIRAKTISEAGSTTVSVATSQLRPEESTEIAVDTVSFGLPRGSFEHSGSLVLWGELDSPGREPQTSAPLALFFHAVQDGWRVYDHRARDESYSEGALTQAARAHRAAITARLPSGVRLWSILPAAGSKVSDSTDWRPEEDGPADPDEQEGGVR